MHTFTIYGKSGKLGTIDISSKDSLTNLWLATNQSLAHAGLACVLSTHKTISSPLDDTGVEHAQMDADLQAHLTNLVREN